jgi:hypothetical protein
MITELADLLDDFPGEANRTRCFAHILNLVAKSIIKQFDVPKAQADEVLDDAAKELAALAVDLDLEERLSREEQLFEGVGDEEDEDDDPNDGLGWTDVRAQLSDNEQEALDKTLQPVRLVLVKASCRVI